MDQEKKFLSGLLKDNDTIVFACSGGPDSMCLLSLLLEVRKEKNLTLVCAHVNHNIRKESKEEYEFVSEYCQKRNIIFEGLKITSYSKGNFHEEAHQKRRTFFNEIVKKYQAQYLMTAHHGDDLIETILMRLTRGSSIEGYIGFSKVKNENGYLLVRPLITVTKEQIKKYNECNNIPYVNDSSNENDKYTRNRYRHEVLPFLKKENKNVHIKFLQFQETICRINEFLVKFTANALTDCLDNDTLLIVEIKKYESFIQYEIIKKYLYHTYQNDIVALKEKHIKAVMSLIDNPKSNLLITLPKGWVARKNYDKIKLEKNNKEESFLIELKEEVTVSSGRIYKIDITSSKSNDIIRLNSEEITLPLYVRNRKQKDEIETKNLQGHQKVKKIFIDKKIPLQKRDSWPILVDAKDRILWIPGLKKSKFDKDIHEKYDIIYKYDISEEKKNAKKKQCQYN